VDRALLLRSAICVLASAVGAYGAGCDGDACEEDVRAQVLETRASLVIGAAEVEAEVALHEVERDRGWKHRRCDLEALLLVAPEDAELSLWGCGLRDPIDVLWIREGTIVGVHLSLEPCAEPCGDCPIIAPEGPVDAAIELPSGSLSVDVGASVVGLDPWLPSAP